MIEAERATLAELDEIIWGASTSLGITSGRSSVTSKGCRPLKLRSPERRHLRFTRLDHLKVEQQVCHAGQSNGYCYYPKPESPRLVRYARGLP